MNLTNHWQGLIDDLRFAARSLQRNPGFAAGDSCGAADHPSCAERRVGDSRWLAGRQTGIRSRALRSRSPPRSGWPHGCLRPGTAHRGHQYSGAHAVARAAPAKGNCGPRRAGSRAASNRAPAACGGGIDLRHRAGRRRRLDRHYAARSRPADRGPARPARAGRSIRPRDGWHGSALDWRHWPLDRLGCRMAADDRRAPCASRR